jgi:hypothetical protein
MGSLTVNGFNNSTPATVSFDDGAGHTGTINTLATQFNVTFTNGSTSAAFSTFCIDLFDFVSNGQTYTVDVRDDLATSFANGSAMAYILEHYGLEDLTSNPDQAAAVQLDLWDLSLNNHNPTSMTLNGSVLSSGDPEIFSADLGSNSHAAMIRDLANQYLAASIGASNQASWLDASAAGNALNRGQSLLVAVPLIRPPAPPCIVDPLIAEMMKQMIKMEAAYETAVRINFLKFREAPDPTTFPNYTNLVHLFNYYYNQQTSKKLPPNVEQNVKQLIDQLGDPEFAKRKAAQKDLIDIGYRASALVAAAAANSPDAEIRERASRVLENYKNTIGAEIGDALKMCYRAAYDTLRTSFWSHEFVGRRISFSPFPPEYAAAFLPPIP